MSTRIKRNLKRNNRIFFDLSDKELEIFNNRFVKYKQTNRSKFIRELVLNNYIIINDVENLRELDYEVNKIGNNLNQLTKLSNENKNIYKDTIHRMKDQIKEVNDLIFESLINHNKVR